MADVQLKSIAGRGRNIPKVDLTPMVDLGFILITFFIYTTTLTDIRSMNITMPDKTAKGENAYADTSTITIMPCNKHQLAYYNGKLNSHNIKLCSFKDIRQIINDKQSRLRHLPASFSKEAHNIHVIIKPNDNSTYDDLVTTLDEMAINNVSYYAIADITSEEKELLTNSLH